jgi:type II secretory pathway pseudopilin PulG
MRTGDAMMPRAGGFTYLSLIILIALIGLAAAAGLRTGAMIARAAAEQELLEIGAEFSAALASYAGASPAGQPREPPSIRELLKDSRFPNPRRHLRKLYADPLTGRTEWGGVYLSGSTGLIGIHSLSPARPIKIGNFDARFPNFDGKEHLSEWIFTTSSQLLWTPSRAASGSIPIEPPVDGGVPEPVARPAPDEPEPEGESEPSAPSA